MPSVLIFILVIFLGFTIFCLGMFAFGIIDGYFFSYELSKQLRMRARNWGAKKLKDWDLEED